MSDQQGTKNLVGVLKTHQNQYGVYQTLWFSPTHMQQLNAAFNLSPAAGITLAIKQSQKGNVYVEILPPRPPQQGAPQQGGFPMQPQQPAPMQPVPQVYNPVPQQQYPPQTGTQQFPNQAFPQQQIPQPAAAPGFPQQPPAQAFPQAPMNTNPPGDPFNRGQ